MLFMQHNKRIENPAFSFDNYCTLKTTNYTIYQQKEKYVSRWIKRNEKSKYKIYFWHLTRKWYDGYDRNSDLMCMIWFKLYISWQQKITSSTLFYLIVSITVIHHMRNEVSNIPYLWFDAWKEILDQYTRIFGMKMNLILMSYNFSKNISWVS